MDPNSWAKSAINFRTVNSEATLLASSNKDLITFNPSITVTMVRVTLESTSHPMKLETSFWKYGILCLLLNLGTFRLLGLFVRLYSGDLVAQKRSLLYRSGLRSTQLSGWPLLFEDNGILWQHWFMVSLCWLYLFDQKEWSVSWCKNQAGVPKIMGPVPTFTRPCAKITGLVPGRSNPKWAEKRN